MPGRIIPVSPIKQTRSMPPVRRNSRPSGALEFANVWRRWGEYEHHDSRYSIVVDVVWIEWFESYDREDISRQRVIVSVCINPFRWSGQILSSPSNLLDS